MYVMLQMKHQSIPWWKPLKIIFKTSTVYPVSGKIMIEVELENKESFELMLRIPAWSKQVCQ